MEGFGSLVFIIIIVVISLLGKLAKKPQTDEQPPPVSPDEALDWSDLARRLLSGQGEVRRARPRAPADAEDWTPVTPAAPAPEPQRYAPRTAQPRQGAAGTRQGAAGTRQGAAGTRQGAAGTMPRQTPLPVATTPRAAPTKATRPPDYSDADRPRLRPDQVKHVPSPTIKKSIQTSLLKSAKIPQPPTPVRLEQVMQKKLGIPVTPQTAALPQHLLFQNLDEVRKGIILSEILGLPVSMR